MNKQQHKRTKLPVWLLGLIVFAVFCNAGTATGSKAQTKPDTTAKVRLVDKLYGKLPLSFEANQGQTDKRVQFISRGQGYSLFLTPTEAVLSLHKSGTAETKTGKFLGRTLPILAGKSPGNPVKSSPDKTATLRMKLVGANPSPQIKGLDELPGKINYFRGKNPKQWQTNIPTYAKTKYEKVYPGIDLVYYGNQRQLEYDFIVAPGADPKTMRLSFEGADKATIDTQGNLVLQTAGGEVRLRKPIAYQTVNGQRYDVDVLFVLHDAPRSHGKIIQGEEKMKSQQIGFQLAAYNATQTLVIDPVLAYSSYLGGEGSDYGNSIAVDSAGNAYVTGSTSSTNYPVVNAKYPVGGGFSGDAFLTKFDASGTQVLYSTFLGGNGSDRGNGIAVDSTGNAYVSGVTNSNNFPAVNAKPSNVGGKTDAFVTKFDASGGQMLYSRYLGGRFNDSCNGIAVDSAGNAYVTGTTDSPDFPMVNALYPTYSAQSAFVTKFNANGSQVLYSTYLGGLGSEGKGIAVDSVGNAHITGLAHSPGSGFQTVNALYPNYGGGNGGDAFVTKFNTSGTQVLYSTYLGGDNTDYGNGIAVDSAGNAYVTGYTLSTDFPAVNAMYPNIGRGSDAFVTKFNASGSQVQYSTYLGGNWTDEGKGIAVDSAGNAYVIGITGSSDFPADNAMYPNLTGGGDAFVTKFDASGAQVLYSTHLGGNSANWLGYYGAAEGNGIAVDNAGNAYVTGNTDASHFPTHANEPSIVSYDPEFNGGYRDAFVAKISDSTPSVDTDRDGMPDNYEIANGFNPNAPSDAGLDKDNDGLSNLQEFQQGTNPNNIDTDGDGYNDANEVVQGTDPLNPNSFPQSTTVSKNVSPQVGPNLPVVPDVNFLYSGKLTLYPDGLFYPEKPTVVITHGWNPSGNTATPEWMTKMADAIGVQANVFLWNWQEKAVTKDNAVCFNIDPLRCNIPYDNVELSGKDLAVGLELALCKLPNSGCAAGSTPTYDEKIHFIGHSLGSGVITYAAKNLTYYKGNLDHLTLLDSPYYFSEPGGTILYELKKAGVFIDNYRSIFGNIFKNANVNVLLPNISFISIDCKQPFTLFTEPHGFAHDWYYSSYQDFQCPSLLGDSTAPPKNSPPLYGSNWAGERNENRSNRINAAWLYSSIDLQGKWKLYAVSQIPAVVSSSVVFLANTDIRLAQAAKDQIIDYAQKTAAEIKVVAVNTYNTASDAENYFVDKANHAVWKLLQYGVNGFFELSLNSSAVLHSNILVPKDANAMRFSYEFLSADEGGVLEVFLGGNRVYAALSKDYVGQGQQYADWIDVSRFAGKHMELSYRLSNAIEGRQGVVALDDLIFAHIEGTAFLVVKAPNSGEVWNEGSKQTITWVSQSTDSKKSLLIYLSTDNGLSWKKIATAKDIGSKIWKIPTKRYVSKQALIKICLNQKIPLCDTSDAVFTINKAPVAEAGVKQKVIVGTEVVLNGNASYDADNGPAAITYKWVQTRGPQVALNDADTATPSFIPTLKGTYVFGLVVNDSSAESKQDKITVSVKAAP